MSNGGTRHPEEMDIILLRTEQIQKHWKPRSPNYFLSATNTEDPPILHEEAEAAMISLKKRKSARVDNIPGDLLQAGEYEITSALLTICNSI
ncbi:hypothetical protein DPMN_045720 [Dreissena polymorpha]|uniref:Uncharacterized protein n=1 Tax=Dreissena polymorpha TaxID=45954 RepID=A0A9D4HZY7_DREPO|nr:hypothetical protein DPMN_045720 [Dreissena polymorpha]